MSTPFLPSMYVIFESQEPALNDLLITGVDVHLDVQATPYIVRRAYCCIPVLVNPGSKVQMPVLNM